jgi:hypothetical protein
MRKKVKTITKEVHEYGVISFDIPLYEKLLDIAQMDQVRDEHIDLIIEKTIKISEEEEGDALTMEHLPAIIAGTPAAKKEVTEEAE